MWVVFTVSTTLRREGWGPTSSFRCLFFHSERLTFPCKWFTICWVGRQVFQSPLRWPLNQRSSGRSQVHWAPGYGCLEIKCRRGARAERRSKNDLKRTAVSATRKTCQNANDCVGSGGWVSAGVLSGVFSAGGRRTFSFLLQLLDAAKSIVK